VAVSPDGSRVYISNVINNSVTVVDAAAANIVAEINIENNPWDIGVRADNSRVYVSQYHSENVSVVDSSINIPVAKIQVGSGPAALAVKPNGERLYTASVSPPSLAAINTADNKIIKKVRLPFNGPYFMAISPEGRYLYITNDYYAVHIVDTSLLEPKAEEAPVLNPIRFDFDRAEIKQEFIKDLDNVVAFMKNHPDMKLDVGGHASFEGTDDYNNKLSMRRAKAVQKYLIDNGIAAARLSIKAFGEQMPSADNKTAEGRALNRRVEFAVAAESAR